MDMPPAADADRVEVRYDLPLAGDAGRVQLYIAVPVVCSTAERQFILDVMDQVARFTAVAVPGAGPDAARLVACVRAWDAEARHVREQIQIPEDGDPGGEMGQFAAMTAETRARELEGCSGDLRRVLADAPATAGLLGD
jgi:hypothetical protein